MVIRAYRDDDLGAVLDIWFRASKIAHHFLPDEFFERERRAIAEEWMPAAETVVCERDGRVVGSLSLIGDEVGGLFVDPDAQGTGVGRALLSDAVAKRSRLELSVFEANTRACRFYETYGFVAVGNEADDATGEPTLRMRLDSGSAAA